MKGDVAMSQKYSFKTLVHLDLQRDKLHSCVEEYRDLLEEMINEEIQDKYGESASANILSHVKLEVTVPCSKRFTGKDIRNIEKKYDVRFYMMPYTYGLGSDIIYWFLVG